MNDFDKFTKHLRETKGYVYSERSKKLYHKSYEDDSFVLVADTPEQLEHTMRWRYDGDWNSYRNDRLVSVVLTKDGVEKALQGLRAYNHNKYFQASFNRWITDGV